MKKLFLTSKFAAVAEKLLPLLNQPPQDLNVAFIITASDPYDKKPWMEEDEEALVKMGFKVFNVDIKNKIYEELDQELSKSDIIFVGGGNTSYLLQKTLESGFDKIVKNHVSKGKWYIGSSAGSILAGPSTEPFWGKDERQDLPPDFKMHSFQALNLVDFVILPHGNIQKHHEMFKNEIIPKFSNSFDFKLLADNEVIIIDE